MAKLPQPSAAADGKPKCVICERPDKRCHPTASGGLIVCHSAASGRTARGGGWLHRNPNPPAADFPKLAAEFARNLNPALKAELAGLWKLPPSALGVFPLAGYCPPDRYRKHGLFTLPMTRAGEVCGFMLRTHENSKDGWKGGKCGPFVLPGWRGTGGPLCLVEGPSDATAGVFAGLACVGRSSATAGRDELAALVALLADWPTDRPITAVMEPSKPGKGDAGEKGGRTLAAALTKALSGRTVRAQFPPDGAKDMREWLTDGRRGALDWLARGAEWTAKLIAAAAPIAEPAAKPSAAELLTGIGTGTGFELWHDTADVGFATVAGCSYPVRSPAFRKLLIHEFRKRGGGRVPGGDALASAVDAIDAEAVHDRPRREAHVRVAGHGGRTYLHLADDASTVIEVDTAGWRVCRNPPVRFRKPNGMLPLPMPVQGGTLADLRRFVNVPEDDQFALLVAWLCGALFPGGPFPVLVLTGEQGTAKSTTAKVVKRLLDPCKAELRSEPKEVRDLMVSARNNWLLGFDNVSTLPPWLSDAFCCLTHGGGFSARGLFTDDEEVIFEAKRPLVMNGIDEFVTRPDLLQRSLVIRHPLILAGDRRTEAELWGEFDSARPALLGALPSRVSNGMRELPRVRLIGKPRMADFAVSAVACERGAKEPARFLAAFADNQAAGHEQAIDASPVAAALVQLMDGRDGWRDTRTELLAVLSKFTPGTPYGWPKSPAALTKQLRRLASPLREGAGLSVEVGVRSPGGASEGKRTRLVVVSRTRPLEGAGKNRPHRPPMPQPARMAG